MTIDKSALKAMAEAAPEGPWFGPEYAPGTGYVFDADLVTLLEYQSIETEKDACLRYVAAANPAAVLALLSEIDRVKARLCVCRDCAGQGEVYSGHDSYQGHFQPPEPDMEVCGTCGGDGVLGSLEDFESLAAERDKLKAENESLKRDRTDWQAECLKKGFEYVREPDAHYVLADVPEMAELLGQVLGVEVRSKDNDDYGETVSSLNEQMEACNSVYGRAYDLEKEVEALRKDKDRLDALEANGWDIRNSSSPMADTGDYNQAIEIVGHWMDKPHERVIGEDYSENLRAAIDQAMKAPAYPPARPEYDF